MSDSLTCEAAQSQLRNGDRDAKTETALALHLASCARCRLLQAPLPSSDTRVSPLPSFDDRTQHPSTTPLLLISGVVIGIFLTVLALKLPEWLAGGTAVGTAAPEHPGPLHQIAKPRRRVHRARRIEATRSAPDLPADSPKNSEALSRATGARSWEGQREGGGFFQTFVARTDEEWPDWTGLPTPDFHRFVAVGVVADAKPTSGYRTAITQVLYLNDRVLIVYREMSPSEGTPVSPGFRQPYAIRLIPTTNLPVTFQNAAFPVER